MYILDDDHFISVTINIYHFFVVKNYSESSVLGFFELNSLFLLIAVTLLCNRIPARTV